MVTIGENTYRMTRSKGLMNEWWMNETSSIGLVVQVGIVFFFLQELLGNIRYDIITNR